jgi:ketosteroid isomerase-like protein
VAYPDAVSDPDSALELCLRYRDAFFARDVEAILALVTPDFVFENVTSGERVQGLDTVRRHIAAIHSRWPDMHFVDATRGSCPVSSTRSPNGRRGRRTRTPVR